MGLGGLKSGGWSRGQGFGVGGLGLGGLRSGGLDWGVGGIWGRGTGVRRVGVEELGSTPTPPTCCAANLSWRIFHVANPLATHLFRVRLYVRLILTNLILINSNPNRTWAAGADIGTRSNPTCRLPYCITLDSPKNQIHHSRTSISSEYTKIT